MLASPEWLALEVKDVGHAKAFYDAVLRLKIVEERAGETALAAGDTELRLRPPGPVPRGGLHTHFALSVPETEYDEWYDRLDDRFDLVEESFGGARSLYFYDPAGNCVELGERPRGASASDVGDLFELVLEVERLDAAVDFYGRLGFDVVDDGRSDGRVRLTTGEFDLELWSPRLGIADGRGGVHVDFGVAAGDSRSVAREVADDALAVTSVDAGVRIRDPDGHYVTLVGE